jgi:hypothetical protein
MKTERIVRDFGFANLVIETNDFDMGNGVIVQEINAFLENKDGNIFQDIACVRQPYDIHSMTLIPNKIEVLVYSDSNNEDYTHSIVIDEFKMEDEQ